jgi:hypothetical protein
MPNPTTPASFLENWPLYAKWKAGTVQVPNSISLRCGLCKKETTWSLQQRSNLYDVVSFSGLCLQYTCVLCTKLKVCFFVRTWGASKDEELQKIGQFPSQSIDIPADLERQLGDDAVLYKNALVCRSQNYGIGALAYMRRVVENKTNELIEVVAEQAASYGVDAADVAKIRAAKDDRISYEERLRIASEAIPRLMKPDGANPLAVLFDLSSAGLHSKPDQECLEIADEIREVFEYVFSRLRAEIEDRTSMITKVKKWAGGRKEKA